MKVETIKQFNLITYLHWQFLFLAWSNFYIRNNVYLQPFRILPIPLPGTCGKRVKRHESMKACFHAFVLQLSRYMKIRWHYMKHAFMPLYCNYQGTWKSGDTIYMKYTFILILSSSVSKFHHQIAMYLKMESI